MKRNKTTNKYNAFSLIELSIVILIIGILIAGVTKGSNLVSAAKLSAARSLTKGSDVLAIQDLIVWLETTSIKSLTDAEGNKGDAIEDRSNVKQWHDLTVQNSTFSNTTGEGFGGTGAEYIRDGINGLPILRFDGVDDAFELPNNTITSGNSAYTIITVFKILPKLTGSSDIAGILYAGYYGTTNSNNALIYDYANDRMGHSFRNRYEYTPANSLLEEEPVILTTSYDATTNADAHKMYHNGSLSASFAGEVLEVDGNTNTIGKKHEGGGDYLHGEIAEIIIYDRSLKNSERRDIESYLSQKWNIALE